MGKYIEHLVPISEDKFRSKFYVLHSIHRRIFKNLSVLKLDDILYESLHSNIIHLVKNTCLFNNRSICPQNVRCQCGGNL